MKKYEILVILQPKISGENLNKVSAEIEKKINGKIVKKEEMGTKQFAYPIKKENEGIYILYYVETDGSNIAELKNYFNLSRNVLRNIILSHEKKFPYEMKTSKDLVFPERKSREDGDGRSFRKPYSKERRYSQDSEEKKNTSSEVKETSKEGAE